MLFSALQGLINWTKHFSHLTKVHEQAVLKISLQAVREGKHASGSVEVTGMNLGKEKKNTSGDCNCSRTIT